jgi:Flp pilus assembly protein TadG
MSQPGWRGKLRPQLGQSERGSLTLMLVVMFVALIALAGLVVDGGAKVTAAEDATSAAQEAARAGAGMVDRANAYANGSVIVDQGQAIAEANQFLANAGYTGRAVAGPAGENSIEVTVWVVRPTKVLSIIGIDTVKVTGTATATLVSGVTGPGQ